MTDSSQTTCLSPAAARLACPDFTTICGAVVHRRPPLCPFPRDTVLALTELAQSSTASIAAHDARQSTTHVSPRRMSPRSPASRCGPLDIRQLMLHMAGVRHDEPRWARGRGSYTGAASRGSR
eukprot:112539-Rhodomonas_salina.1